VLACFVAASRWVRALAWLFAIRCLSFSPHRTFTVDASDRVANARIEASEALHSGHWRIWRRFETLAVKMPGMVGFCGTAAGKLQSPGRMVAYVKRMPDEDPTKAVAVGCCTPFLAL